jgi:hypothetical protein
MKASTTLFLTIAAIVGFSTGFLSPMRVSSFVRHKEASASQTMIRNRSIPTLQAAPKKRLLDQALVDLTGSSLVYTYAELRLMSLALHTETKFDFLDSEKQPITARTVLIAFLTEWDWAVDHGSFDAPGEDYRSSVR